MGIRMNALYIVCLLGSIYRSNGCSMEGVTIWQLPIAITIEDYHDGIILQRTVSDIGGLTLTSSTDLNGGPYIDAAIENSAFVLRTNNAYRLFEENETEDRISLTYTFSCTNGVSLPSPLTIIIDINDNNNNDPLFKTPDTAASTATTYNFTIAPPVPPGFLITNCVSDIIVRDIDLTTYRIDFTIEDNPYFEIEYDGSTVAKEFKAVLRTTSFIRSIPEPIILTISATDVDLTGDPPITTTTTVTIHGSSEFELPQEPVFSQVFYFANYTENNQIVLEESITLQQGYDDLVQFSLEGDYAAYFAMSVVGNDVSLSTTSPLPAEVLQQGQIYLVVNAAREYTSGASATIVVLLPEAVKLEFEQPHYEGEIVDNTLQPMQLLLTQGYQGSAVTVAVEGYSSFTASVVGNIITLTMTTPLDETIIQENSFINLRVTASADTSSATTIVTLELVKDDVTTPVFGEPLYTGTYDSSNGLMIEPFVLVQGYDDTVNVSLSGEHASYFALIRNGASSTLQLVEELSSNILSQGHLLLTVEAAKPRTVGATAAVSITLPAARELQFQAGSYKGSIQDNMLTLENIILNVGYEDDVIFSLTGDYSTLFAVSNVQNQVAITLPTQLPQEVISENNFIMLTLTATGLFAQQTTTAVLLEIIKDDATTPVFSQPIYRGTYLGSLDIDIGNINLVQGYDSSVTFRIEGENSEYFSITENQNVVTLSVLSNIPEEVIFNEKMFVFNIFADKPLTVGANAAIAVKFSKDLTEPTILQFADNTYIGSLEDSILTLESIVLETGFAANTQFILSGEYASSFTHTVSNNAVTLLMTSALPTEVIENNKFIVLELEARRDRAVSTIASIIVEIVEEEIVIPVFSQAYYTGIYAEENTLQFQETITLQQGYNDNVTFSLEGESAEWFAVSQNGNSATIVSTSAVPQDVLDNYHQLLFTVVAYKPNTINGEAAISIELPKDVLEIEVLRFAQSSYEGELDGSELQVPTITLSNEITENVQVSLSGAYATYFTASINSNITILLENDLPAEVLSDNEFIIIDITASKPDAINGYTALVIRIVKEPIVTPVFEQAFYTGEISVQGDLVFEHTMRLIQGFDGSVSFTLNGDGSERFNLMITGENSLSLSIAEGGTDQMENISHLVFSIVASKAGSVSGEAAIVIHNINFSTARSLKFSQNHYRGSLEDNILTMESISLVEGYEPDVQFSLSGDYGNYFQLLGEDGTYTLQLVPNITTEDFVEDIVVLTIEAVASDTRTHATIIIELIKDDNVLNEALEFDETYYVGSYSVTNGVMAGIQLRLLSGYDSSTIFTLEEGFDAWFDVQHSESNVTISLMVPLPIELFFDGNPLIFAINANNSGGNRASATIVITVDDGLSEITVLGFERNNYIGTIDGGTSNLEPITLIQGYNPEVNFTLQGVLSEYFTINQQDSTVNIVLQSIIPEEVIANRLILLELEATSPQAISATTTIVLDVVASVEPIFESAYYIGQYSDMAGLVFETVISLQEGYDQDVQFSLTGEHAQWFNLEVQANSVTLTTSGAIPPTILVNNHQLVFLVTAQKPNSNIARATIVISLVDDYTEATILGFERSSYLGTLENNTVSLEPIVLTEGYSDAVTFTLHGDLAIYFSLQQQGSTVNVLLQSAIPEQTLPANRVVIIEVRAAAEQSIPATTTVVLETQQAMADEQLAFEAAYYVGQYSETGGLVFDTAISLQEGYSLDVQFALEGDHAQWFNLEVQGNFVMLTITGAIPPAILVNNHHLVFLVNAQKPNSNIARATIVISLVDDYTEATILGFERSSYLGTLENNVVSLDPIILTEGYSDVVTFTLQGDLATYFSLQQQGSTINVVLQSAIPEQVLPANRVIIIEVRAAAAQSIPATTTVVLETQQAVTDEQLAFEAAYYVGQYSETGSFVFDTAISLQEGYDQDVQFALEGDHAQWFNLEVQGNSVTLTTTGAIPPAILVNNHQLVFLVTAQKPNSNIARATIVISLVEDYTEATILGFERSSYLGTLENNVVSLDPIILTEGYSDVVTFTLQGDLATYFSLQQQGSTINVVLQSAIPEQVLTANRVIIIEVRAVAAQSIPATTTVVLETQQAVTDEQLAFEAAYYVGQYSETGSFVFDTAISLQEGYDQDVQFALEGDHAQWFNLEVQGNSVTLTTYGAIPPAILVNNHQLVFIVTAQKPNSNIARATIVISLVDDYTEATILGFERSSYRGTLENNAVSLEPIVLTEGYSDAVTFTLHGDLAIYFSLQQQGSTVNVLLQRAIPEQTLPANRVVIIEVRAAAEQSIPATTTVVLETQQAMADEQLAFEAAYYVGQYSETGGLVFDTAISLQEGYNQDVQFALEGDHAQWFNLEVQGNFVMLTITGAIPPAILVNNHHLVFLVNAQKPNSNIARATIVISLVDDYTEATILGFERSSYLGTLENNVVSLDPIILTEGYSDVVTFTLQGDLATYFSLQQQGSTINVVLQSAIPEQVLPANRVIIIEVRAAAAQSIPATTTVVLETQQAVTDEQLAFEAAYYVGQYSETGSFVFDTAISLQEGYDQDVQFALEGDHAQWFNLEVQGNSVTLTTTGAIPPAILVNNHQLVFLVTAQKPNSNIARATIVISLVEDYTEATILGFERSSYLGTLENNVLSLDPIFLSEGYTDAVTFTLHGDLATYFSLQQQGSTVNVVLQSAIPEQVLPANRVIIIEMRAVAAQSIPATTAVVLETQQAVTDEQLAFEAAYYVGQYSETGSFVFDTAISLQEGYDPDVQFALEGDHAQWFDLEVQGNSVTLTTSGAIPPAILVNNHQLVFLITAQKPNSNIARATIVISLVDDYTEATSLGFERSSYLGTLENNVVSLDPIILTEGYSDVVTFTLQGDLATYFSLQQQDSTVNVVLQSAIPEQVLLANSVVIIEVRAAAAQSIPATTTVVLETQQAVTDEQLAFEAAYYVGEYSKTGSFVFDTAILLQEGYDQDVQFALEGDHAQWFNLEVQGNSVTLTTSGAIPPAILVNNHQLVFLITAQKPNSNIARATIVISLVDDYTEATILGFEQSSYLGTLENNVVSLDPIILTEGYSDVVTFTLQGDLATYFSLQQQDSTVNVVLQSAIPEQVLLANSVVIIEVRAAAAQSIPATTTVVLETQQAVTDEQLAFEAAYYVGEYSETGSFVFDTAILLQEGYDQDVQFALEGDHAQWFNLEVQGNSVTLTTSGAIPPAILVNNHQLVFLITAQKPNSNIARATIVISLVDDYTEATILGFERSSYLGTLENNVLSLDPVFLSEGYSDAVTFTLHGDLATYFSLQQQDSTVNVVLQSAIPEQVLLANSVVIIEVRAAAAQSIPATTTVVLETQQTVADEQLAFEAAYYVGQYSETGSFVFDTAISLQEGYDQDVQFALEGDHAQWFNLEVQSNSVTLTTSGAIPPAILVNNHQLVFLITAQKPNSNIARATIVISLVDDYTEATILGFERSSYLGTLENNVVSLDPIFLSEGYSDAVTFTLHGDLATYFSLQQQDSTVNVVLQSAIPEQVLPANRVIIIEVRAAAAQSIPATTTVVLETQQTVADEQLAFETAYYVGQYSETGGLVFDTAISLQEGYDSNVWFTLEGDHAEWFSLSADGNLLTLSLTEPIPAAILVETRKFIMIVRAMKEGSNSAMTIVIISVMNDSGSDSNVAFDKVLYEGTINLNVVQHEPITITEYTGSSIEILGAYRELFSASVSDGTVVVGASGTLGLPDAVTHVALELRAGGASAVLVLGVIQSETPELPTVTFGSPNYVLRADMSQTGLVGQVQATASNGETLAYSLGTDDAHLQERVSINSGGEINLSAPTNSGVYNFQVIATAVISQVQATAMVQLTVEAASTCGDEHTLPPLIILDRDEEEPHDNLVVLDNAAQAGCQFTLTNRWPADQDWLYVNETGLHARIIDREDPRIAFMALSQIQVELVLVCASDTQSRSKRSTNGPRLDWLGPYEYGNNKWILTDTILYNSRRSFVNLIVNDINDNYPIFVEEDNEPIVCGYPIPELEDIVLPRALAELKATDADVGENAALSFSSSEEVLAVSPATGSVHVRDGATLEHDQLLTVTVTDLNGREDGLTTSIQLLVKLIDASHIAVVTVRNAFLDQEETILSNLSSAVGYEVKVLSSAVISDDPADSVNARNKREVTNDGASLQLYVYGVIDREPVAVDQLTNDISELVLTGVDVTSTVSLEDHLEGREIAAGRDVGLLVATIVLSVLLFILILAITIWFFLRWRKARNYEQFSDATSLASRTEPLEQPPKADTLKKPRLNIEELKRSERRLQEMLDAPIDDAAPKAQTSQINPEDAFDTIINIAPPETALPIVIQSIDKLKDDSGDEDEFGERKNKSRRKSVVTFNENVEKIIHVEDLPDDNSSDVEVFKF